jgi:hypothetical protein
VLGLALSVSVGERSSVVRMFVAVFVQQFADPFLSLLAVGVIAIGNVAIFAIYKVTALKYIPGSRDTWV